MTLQEITNVASILIGKQVDTALANIYTREGLQLLSAQYATSCPVKCLQIVCSKTNEPYPLPKNRGIYKVYRNKKRYPAYEYDECGISFSEEGEYLVYYYSAFSGELSPEETVPVAPEYDSELCKYVAFSVLRADDPSNRVADRLIAEFHENCKVIHQSIAARLHKRRIPLATEAWR